jgi:hypothetical protein
MKPEWGADWAWGLPLTVITLAIHGAAVSGVAVLLTHAEALIESRRPERTPVALIVAATGGGVGAILTFLTGLEATIWAGAYLLLGAVGTVGDAMLYSVDSTRHVVRQGWTCSGTGK